MPAFLGVSGFGEFMPGFSLFLGPVGWGFGGSEFPKRPDGRAGFGQT